MSPTRPPRRVREVVPFVLLACACGAAVSRGSRATPTATVASTATSTPASVPDPFDDLVALGPSLAPGMREVARRADGASSVDLLRADAADTCVRVAFAATSPVTARLLDRSGAVLASTAASATTGALGERGPVCVRKGDVVRAAIDGGPARVRWVAWQAP